MKGWYHILDNLLYSINVVLPIILITLLGYILKRRRFVTEGYIAVSTKLAFNIAFPCSIFAGMQGVSLSESIDMGLIMFLMVAITVSTLLLLLIVPRFVKDRPTAASVVQGMFRANFLVQGLPLLTIMYGEGNFVACTILLPFAVAINNVMATVNFVVLIPEQRGNGKRPILGALIKIAKNPLFLGSVAGLLFAGMNWSLPSPLTTAVENLGRIATPMALISLGAEFEFGDVLRDYRFTIPTVLVRLIVLPAVITGAAILFGFRGSSLGGIFLFTGASSAASGYIMSKTMGGNESLAAQCVCLSSVFSAFTLILGIFLLKSFNLI